MRTAMARYRAAALAEAFLRDVDLPTDRIDAVIGCFRDELAPVRRSLKAEL